MNITIDCRMIEASGVGVYLRECLPYLLDSPHTFTLIGNREKLAPLSVKYANTEIIHCNIKPFSMEELFAFPRSILKKINRTALFYSPYFNFPGGIKVPLFTTIHDIIFPDMPELVSKTGLAVRMWFYRRAFGHSRKIFTVSEFSKSRIEHYLGVKTPVVVTYNGVQSYFLDTARKNIDKKKFILFIGNIKRHKGLWCLIDAFLKAQKAGLGHKLVIVGNKDNFRSTDSEILKIIHNSDPSMVEFTGFIDNEKLKTLLSEAALLVQPSLYEGFGYPPLEAMISGTKALISDIPVFREIYGDFPVVFFRSGDPEDLAEKMTALLDGKEPERISLPYHLAAKYTFKNTASIILREICK